MGGGLKPSSLIEVYAYGAVGTGGLGQGRHHGFEDGGGGKFFLYAFWVKIGFKIVISMEYLWDFEKVQ